MLFNFQTFEDFQDIFFFFISNLSSLAGVKESILYYFNSFKFETCLVTQVSDSPQRVHVQREAKKHGQNFENLIGTYPQKMRKTCALKPTGFKIC